MKSKDIRAQLDKQAGEDAIKLQERKEAFAKEMEVVCKKYDLVFASQALLTPDGRITSRPQLIDGKLVREAEAKQKTLSE
jgi:hypothetical protein